MYFIWQVYVRFVIEKEKLDFFFRILRPYPDASIPPILNTRLCLEPTLSIRAKGRSLRAFGTGKALDGKLLSHVSNTWRQMAKESLRCVMRRLCKPVVESSWNVMAHGDARVEKWRGNYLGTWCIQHYHRRCAHLSRQPSTELTPPPI